MDTNPAQALTDADFEQQEAPAQAAPLTDADFSQPQGEIMSQSEMDSRKMDRINRQSQVEFQRGLEKGFGRLVAEAGSLTRFGALNLASGGALSNTLMKYGKGIELHAEDLPQTDLPPMGKATLQTAGEMIPAAGEFAAIEAAGVGRAMMQTAKAVGVYSANPAVAHYAKKLLKPLSAGSVFAVQQAVEETTREGHDLSSIAEAGQRGFALGMLADPIVERGLSLMQTGSKAAAKLYINAVTNSRFIAESFVNDPIRFSVFKKMPFVKDIQDAHRLVRAENERKMTMLAEDYKANQMAMTERHANEKFALDNEIKDSKFALDSRIEMSKKALERRSSESLEATRDEATKVFATQEANVQHGLQTNFEQFVEKAQTLKKFNEDQIELSFQNLLQKDPGALIHGETYMEGLHRVLRENGMPVVEGKIIPSGAESLAKAGRYQAFYDDVSKVAEENGGNIPLAWAMNTKGLLSRNAYQGGAVADPVLAQLSGVLKPEKMVDSIIGKQVDAEVAHLAKAKHNYETFIPRYEEAIRQFSIKDAQGNATPSFSKALSAVLRNDTAVVNQIRKADMALPNRGDAMLPKLREAAKQVEEADVAKKRLITIEKRRISDATEKLHQEEVGLRKKLSEDTRKKNFESARKRQTELANLQKTKMADINKHKEFVDSLEKSMLYKEETLEINEKLRGAFAAGRTGNIQTGLTMGTIASGFAQSVGYGNPVYTGASAVGSVLMAPKVASNIVKAGLNTGQAIGQASERLGISQLLNLITKEKAIRRPLISTVDAPNRRS